MNMPGQKYMSDYSKEPPSLYVAWSSDSRKTSSSPSLLVGYWPRYGVENVVGYGVGYVVRNRVGYWVGYGVGNEVGYGVGTAATVVDEAAKAVGNGDGGCW